MTPAPTYAYTPDKNRGGVTMGSIWKHRDRWYVGFYFEGKQHIIGYYKGEKMYSPKTAQKCLSLIQSRKEDSLEGKCLFRIEEFTGQGWTDVNEYYGEWMREVIEPKRKPATIKGYWSYYRNWISPFFNNSNARLHEIQLDTLTALLNSIRLSGKGKLNVMMAFHSMMDYAWRSRRIPEMPPFPKREDYNIVEPTIKWLSEDRQMAIINAIPEIHRPIFLWLKYHLRRPSEACALKWEDYDVINEIFIIRRSISARREVGSTKTGSTHIIPCHPLYYGTIKGIDRGFGGYIFKNPAARRSTKRYTNESLNGIWRKSCRSVAESIDLYSGLKHSSCSQYINEKGLSLSELQIITDHKRLDSVRKYAKVEVARKRALMERTTNKVLTFKKVSEKDQ